MIELEVQSASSVETIPGVLDFGTWLATAVDGPDDVSLVIRVVDEAEMQDLNARYRGLDKTTNVLSFPSDVPESIKQELEAAPLGDIVICAPVVEAEAQAQGKPPMDHWAHLSIHGLLHLLGHNHEEEDEAVRMEAMEIACLETLGIPDPYK